MTKYNRPIDVNFIKLQSELHGFDTVGGRLVGFARLAMQTTSPRGLCNSAHRVSSARTGNGTGVYLGWWRFYETYKGEA